MYDRYVHLYIFIQYIQTYVGPNIFPQSYWIHTYVQYIHIPPYVRTPPATTTAAGDK